MGTNFSDYILDVIIKMSNDIIIKRMVFTGQFTRFTYYIIIHDGRQVTDVNYRRSPLVQGGLEIHIQVTIEMDAGKKNLQALKKYKDFVSEYYKEPVDGKFDDVTASVLKTLKFDDSDTEESGQEEEEDQE